MSVFNGAEDNSVDMTRKKQVQLDFKIIHNTLNEPELNVDAPSVKRKKQEDKILLLQALRWRIDRPRSILAKR